MLFCFINSYFLISQDQKTDSLIRELKKTKNDSLKCLLLSQLTEMIQDDDVWPIYNHELYLISKKIVLKGNDKSNFYHKLLIGSANNKGYLLDLKGNVDSSLIYFNECLTLSEKINDKNGYTDALYNIGKAYNHYGNIPKALELLTKSLKLAEESGLNEQSSRILISLGLTFHKQGDLIKALEYYQKAYKLQRANNDIRGSAYSLTNLAGIYLDKKDYNNSLKYFSESMNLFLKVGDYSGYLNSKRNTAKIFILTKDYNQAIKICKDIINDPKINLYKPMLSRTYDMLGRAYIESTNFKEAFNSSLAALKIGEELNNPELIRNSNRQLFELYKKFGDYNSALKSYEIYIELRDSLNNQETRKASIKSQLKYEYEKKAAADSVKVVEEKKISQLKLKQEQTQKKYLYAGLIAVGLFGVFMFNRFMVTKKQKNIIEKQKEIVEQQKELVDEKQKEILDSIKYAKRIQESFLPTDSYLNKKIKQNNV